MPISKKNDIRAFNCGLKPVSFSLNKDDHTVDNKVELKVLKKRKVVFKIL
jgi:hypothetical protein